MTNLVSRIAGRLLGRSRPAHPDRAIVAPHFDAEFYSKVYPDVPEAGWDPLEHFLEHGWREGRDPNPRFSTKTYLAEYPELVGKNVNPFVWFLTMPKGEPLLGFRHEIVAATAPYETRIAPARKPVEAEPKAVLAEALAAGRPGLPTLHVSFSHDDYNANLGGVQLALQREAAGIAARGCDHLHIFPARAWQQVRTAADPGQLGVVFDGRAVGVFEPADVIAALAGAATAPARGRSFAIHSLLGHTADETADILAAAGLTRGFFWLHDFASLCAGFHLLRNDVEDCGAPPPESAACEICLYGPWRARHLAAHRRLFRRLKLTVVAPSQATLDLWRRAWSHPEPEATVVHPHARLVARDPAPLPAANRPFRLVYAGLPVDHKGWSVFRGLAARFVQDSRYEFVHIGAREAPDFKLRFRQAAAGAGAPDAMLTALRAEQPDAVMVWPLCRETFSFVAYEAVAAGCAVITGPDSGNVAAFVGAGGHGAVLDEGGLLGAFESGQILSLARSERRPLTYDLAFSALTADLLPETEPA